MDREREEECQRILAEHVSIQLLLEAFMRNLRVAAPDMKIQFLKAFDDAAKQLSIASGGKAAHLPETLKIIEQLRLTLIDERKSQRETQLAGSRGHPHDRA